MNQVMCFSFRGRYSVVSIRRFRDHCYEMMIENLSQVGGSNGEGNESAQGEETYLVLETEGKYTVYK